MTFGIKDAFAVGVPYCISVGACYLFGYWGAFDINVLEFISLADIAKLAVYPVVASFGFMLTGALISQTLHAPLFPPGGGSESKVGKFGRKHWRGMVALQIAVVLLVAIFWPEPGKWFVVASLVSLLATPLSHSETLVQLVPDPQMRSTVLFLIILLPSSSFAYGRQQAFWVKTGASHQFVDVVRSKLSVLSDAKNPVAYLGLLGNTYILREAKTGDVVFVKQRDDSPLFVTSTVR
jgi:hypothetical protein